MLTAIAVIVGLTAIVAGQFVIWPEILGDDAADKLFIMLTAGAGGVCTIWLGIVAIRGRVTLLAEWRDADVAFRLCMTLALAVAIFLTTGFWYGLVLSGFKAYEFRDTFALFGGATGCALLAYRLPIGDSQLHLISRLDTITRQRLLFVTVTFFVIAASLIARGALDGVPHMNDTATYLYQARILWHGQLALTELTYPELFDGLRQSTSGVSGYFPIGWPLLLGAFDSAGVGWLANPVLGASVVVIVYLLIADICNRTVAGLTAALLVGSPWFVLNATDQLTHMASVFWLMSYLLGFVRGIERGSPVWASIAGLALIAAFTTRPQDAVVFALPSAIYGARLLFTDFHRHRIVISIIGLCGCVGIYLYLLQNKIYTGDYFVSFYGRGNYGLQQSPKDLVSFLFWIHESVSELNMRWFGGVFPIALLVIGGLSKKATESLGQRLFLVSSFSLCILYGLFIFQSRAFMGPRWYLPLAPCIAYLLASGALHMLQRLQTCRAPDVARAYLRIGLVAIVTSWIISVPMQYWSFVVAPPHGVSSDLVKAVHRENLSNAIVSLPIDYYDAETGQPNYKIHRNSLSDMLMPLGKNKVIFVRQVENWKRKALEEWPNRVIFCVGGLRPSFYFSRC